MTPNEITVVIFRASKAMRTTYEKVMSGQTDNLSAAARRLSFYYMFTHGHTIENIAKTFRMGDDTVKRGIYKIKCRAEQYRRELAAIDGREG